MDITQSKRLQRQKVKEVLAGLSLEHRLTAGRKVATHVDHWLLKNPAQKKLVIALFVGLSDELCTNDLNGILVKHQAKRALPFINAHDELTFITFDEEVLPPPVSILTPLRTSPTFALDYDIIFIPGLAFDKLGHRLGRGKGYYDRALSKMEGQKNRPLFVGVAMDEQVLPQVSFTHHDVAMDYLCTPTLGMFKLHK